MVNQLFELSQQLCRSWEAYLLSRHFVRILVLISMAYAQTQGIRTSFICDCGGKARVTFSDHCDGPHGNGCHDEGVPIHSKHDHPRDADTRDHAAYSEQLTAVATSADELPAPQLKLDAGPVRPPLLGVALGKSSGPKANCFLARTPFEGRPWPHRLAHTIMLRI